MLIFLSNNDPFSNMLPSPLLAYILCDLRQYSFTKIKCLSHTDTNLLNYALKVEISVKFYSYGTSAQQTNKFYLKMV